MNIIRRTQTAAGASRQVQAVIGAAALRRLEADTSHEPVSGPGWFESSWDLARGLEVCEGLPADAGVEEWLAVHC